MSTKNLARTAIEGGRYESNKHDRYESHVRERSTTRQWLNEALYDEEFADEVAIEERPKVYKGFTDKLGPCWRWLKSNTGRPWDDVRSELHRRFDTRTLSAFHIVNQHMISAVDTDEDVRRGFSSRFYVDADGLLQDHGKWRSRYTRVWEVNEAQMRAYANGRFVIERSFNSRPVWAKAGPGQWQACSRPKTCRHKTHRKIDVTPDALVEYYAQPGMQGLGQGDWWRKYAIEHYFPVVYYQDVEFTDAEAVWWNKISFEDRRKITAK